MKQAHRVVAGIVSVIACVLIAASSGVTYGAVLTNGTSTPAAWVYLPYVSREEPPMPTPLPQDVYILPNYSHRVTSYGNLHIWGEVYNNTDDDVMWVNVSISLFNSSGQLVDIAYTFVKFEDMPAGEKSCFYLATSLPDDWAYFQFEPVDYDLCPWDVKWIDITIFDDYGTQQDGNYKILGFARNDHDSRVEAVRIEGTLYDAEGKVIGCGTGWPSNDDLNPGQTSPFKLDYWGDRPDVASYRLQTDGYSP